MAAPKRDISALVNSEFEKRELVSRKQAEDVGPDDQVDFHFRISRRLRDELKTIFDDKGLTLNGGVRFALIEWLKSSKKTSAF